MRGGVELGGGEAALCGAGVRGRSAHHVIAVDSVRRVLHAVVHLPPEHRQILGEPVSVLG